MKYFKTIYGVIATVAGALSLGPLCAEMLRRWMEKNGFIDNPDQGLAWALSALSSVARTPQAQLALIVVAFLATCYVVGWVVGSYLERRDTKRLTIALEMLELAKEVRGRQGRFGRQWPDNVSDIRPYIESLFLNMRKIGLYAPPTDDLFNRGDGAKLLCENFEFVSIYISEGHWKVAKKRALQLRSEFD